MLLHLSISQFTLVDQLELEFGPGTSALTGETGAGKSITLDALGLALGDRGSAELVRTGSPRADISATFDISDHPSAASWLEGQELDAGQEVILRRTIGADGRSRAYINGQPVTLLQLRTLGEQLIDIHSQHEHQSLLKKDTHRRLLDDYARAQELAAETRIRFKSWQDQYRRYRTLADSAEETQARRELLKYQLQELEQLGLQPGEIEELEREQRQLANAGQILNGSYQLAALLSGGEGDIAEQLHRALQLLSAMPEQSPALTEVAQLLDSARIQVDEAAGTLSRHIDRFEMDPERLSEVEERLSAIYQTARKHRVQPDALPELEQQLQAELEEIGAPDALDKLAAECEQLEAEYRRTAEKLSKLRQRAAADLANEVNRQLAALAMPHARVELTLQPLEKAAASGLEDVEILIATNPGQPPRPLGKIASGGELSRVSLAIQVVTAQTSRTPTLVFDEVDVGIGGATGDVVGRLLRQLGETRGGRAGQVICVTHLAQVAARAHRHYQVEKHSDGQAAFVSLRELKGEERREEIARMLGGETTAQSLAHAEEMLSRN
ncbi:DNA repair protein RecN [Microbulbifer thermotolerans]|uniref:DNA repair protein RecN n=1 Tax=Microbulbifer thermotolerans TaxID=252514 RepID=UPI002249233C|nr:DNA repair protein RecN [Microbulbifer thermotolerans]MCX2783401.1 DNA repair protein RecN [Microbulbifer thermotolerans]MCX2793436.1 DNA repair protein RecN [Microbulbifer thermotolerans]MCX2840620.1 DNA repair protein RecN [Microbulbifer thermotolerans]